MSRLALLGAGGGGGVSSLLTGFAQGWHLDETALLPRAAVVGSADLTVNGVVLQGAGKLGNAAVTDGDAVNFLSRAGTTYRRTGDWTISVWVNPASLFGAHATFGRGIARVTSGDAVGDWMLGVRATGAVRLAHWSSAGSDTDGAQLTVASLVAEGAWSHIVCRCASGVYSIWVNGVTAGELTAGGTSSGWGNVGLEVGRQYDEAVYAWIGGVDELLLYDRALTDPEASELWNAGAGKAHPFS